MIFLDGRELKNVGYRTTVNDIIVCSLLLSLMHATCDALGDKKLQLMNDAMSVIVQIQSDLEGGASGVVDFMHTMSGDTIKQSSTSTSEKLTQTGKM